MNDSTIRAILKIENWELSKSAEFESLSRNVDEPTWIELSAAWSNRLTSKDSDLNCGFTDGLMKRK
jgi:hypothetical protein